MARGSGAVAMPDILIACGLIVACALLNRVRGGGFGGDKLPGRALLWGRPPNLIP